MTITSLPEALSSLFVENPATGQYIVQIYSAVETREVERRLAEHGISYQTRIVRSRKRGVYFLITLLEDVYA
ncbi:MAG: hypothetical protein ABFE08_17715 [Armatimonadia bacterium]